MNLNLKISVVMCLCIPIMTSANAVEKSAVNDVVVLKSEATLSDSSSTSIKSEMIVSDLDEPKGEVDNASPLEALSAPKKEVEVYKQDKLVFKMIKGELKPQAEKLLLLHPNINAADDIQWLASNNYVWPNSYDLSGEAVDELINQLFAPYQLLADFKGNGLVVITQL